MGETYFSGRRPYGLICTVKCEQGNSMTANLIIIHNFSCTVFPVHQFKRMHVLQHYANYT